MKRGEIKKNDITVPKASQPIQEEEEEKTNLPMMRLTRDQ
jgi:hypothetical protein